MLIILITLSVGGCGAQQPEQNSQASAEKWATIDPAGLWEDATKPTIGATGGSTWTNKAELVDINGDGLVDVLFANGGNYDYPGLPEFSQVFLNRGPVHMFEEATRQVFGSTRMLAPVSAISGHTWTA